MTREPRRIPERLHDMLESIANVESDIGEMSKDEFLSDGKTQRAVIESLIVIGEASNKLMQLDPTIEQTTPALWRQLRDAYDMRPILTHEYFRVDAAVVWTTAQDNPPEFRALLVDSVSGGFPRRG